MCDPNLTLGQVEGFVSSHFSEFWNLVQTASYMSSTFSMHPRYKILSPWIWRLGLLVSLLNTRMQATLGTFKCHNQNFQKMKQEPARQSNCDYLV